MSEDVLTIPVVEEELNVSRRAVVTGRVRVQTKTEIVNELVKVPLETSELDIKRIPIGREVDEVPQAQPWGRSRSCRSWKRCLSVKGAWS